MTEILAITAPSYVIIAVGFFAVRSGLFSKADNHAVGRFVPYFCVPPLLFRAFAQRSLAVLALGLAYAMRVRGNSKSL